MAKTKQWDKEEVIKYARLHYEKGWTEQKIADSTNYQYSRATIHRMLAFAKEQKWFQVQVIATSSAHEILRLREEISTKYDLRLQSIHIAPSHYFTDNESQKDEKSLDNENEKQLRTERLHEVAILAGKVFADHLDELNKKNGIVAVGPGELIEFTVAKMPARPLKKLHIVPTNGYLHEQLTEYSANQIGASLAAKIEATFHWLPCVGMIPRDQVGLLKKLPVISSTLDRIAGITKEFAQGGNTTLNVVKPTIVLTGVKDFDDEEDFKRYEIFFGDEVREFKKLVEEKKIPAPLGLICDHLFDTEGAWTKGQTRGCVIGLDLNQLMAIARSKNGTVIFVVIGEKIERTKSLHYALKAGFCNELVTDEATARSLLSIAE